MVVAKKTSKNIRAVKSKSNVKSDESYIGAVGMDKPESVRKLQKMGLISKKSGDEIIAALKEKPLKDKVSSSKGKNTKRKKA